MKMKKDIICAIAGMAAAAGVKLFGGWTPTLSIVLILMGLDLIAGFLVAVVFKKSPKSESGAASSNAMLKGLCKKFMMVCLLAVAHQLDVALCWQLHMDLSQMRHCRLWRMPDSWVL